jgi:hypothetical protein
LKLVIDLVIDESPRSQADIVILIFSVCARIGLVVDWNLGGTRSREML